MKPACRKNTFHINLLGPLVETFALMNHDLSERGGGRGGAALSDGPSGSLAFGRLFSVSLGNGLWFFAGQSSIVPGQRAAERTARSDGISDALELQRQSRTESPWVSRLWPDTGYLSSQQGAEEGCGENRQTEKRGAELSLFQQKQSCFCVCRKGVSTAGRIFLFSPLQARCLHSLAGGGVAPTVPVTDLPNS